jgi:molecular chaperone HtpG
MKNLKDENAKEVDIIGQFGVGFYSSFMVSDNLEVRTRSPYSNKGYLFKSNGTEHYEIEEIEKETIGTEIKLYIRDNVLEDKEVKENYDEFLDDYRIRSLVKKYSDYVRYPINMYVTKSEPKYNELGEQVEGEYEEVKSLETLNSQIPLWKKNKREVDEEQLNEFYKSKYYDYQDPIFSMFLNVEGLIEYNALLFIPKKPPYDLYSDKYEKGLQLYTKGVFIMDKCKELIPDYLRFVKGLVDSSDLSLNISREILQQNRDLVKIHNSIEKKIISELTKCLNNDEDKYIEFFNNYGINLKYGVYDKYVEKKDLLKDLIIYNTINQEKMISLKKYVENMKEGQKFIYYASAKTKEQVLAMPQMDLIKKHDYDVLILKDEIDEFVINVLNKYNDIEFKSVNQGDLDLLDKEEKEKIEDLNKEKKDILTKIKEYLKDEVKDVRLSSRLYDSPVCLVSGDGLSFEMEKVLSQMPNNNEIKADRILEINPNHDLFIAIEKLSENDELLEDYSKLLLDQALLMENLPIKDPVSFTKRMCKLMVNSIK